MATWTEGQMDRLMRDKSPTQPTAPTPAECQAMRVDLPTHSALAIQSMWNDGRSLVLGHQGPQSTNGKYADFLRRRGWM